MTKEMSSSKEGFGISGFTLGIVSIGLAGSLGILLSIIGFILCLVQQKKHPMKLAKAGIILNVIAFILSIVLLVFLIPIIQDQLGNLA